MTRALIVSIVLTLAVLGIAGGGIVYMIRPEWL